MSSPFNWPALEPAENEPLAFRYFFKDIVRHHLPCRHVEVIPAVGGELLEAALGREDREALALVVKKGKPVIDSDVPRLFLPLTIDGKLYATVILEGGDVALYEKFTVADLLKGGKAVTEDFLAFRARTVDPLTGLFNSVAWRETLEERFAGEEDFSLILVEIYPRIRDAAHAYAYLKRAAGSLDSITGQEVPVFHLGTGLFAMLWEKVSIGEAGTMADVILYRLQRDGMSRAHMSQVRVECGSDDFNGAMDRAWKTMVKARQRGPFAKAVYQSEADLVDHPFRPLSATELNRFKDLWRRDERFSVAALHCDQDDDRAFADDIRALLEEGMTLLEPEDGGIYLFIEGGGPEQALTNLKSIQQCYCTTDGRSFSAGVASFPCAGFKRSAIPLNARKALQHTLFLGPAAITPFDGVSLNISGDIYYNEGDMNGAVREYLLGLELDAKNVNLLNSLGVAYVRLDRYKTAISCFDKVLDIEAENFMALFNLGSAWLSLGRDELAVDFLEKALAVDDSIFDLYLQLAELYCRAGDYKKVVGLLAAGGEAPELREEWEDASAFRCLGEAWYNLGEQRQAMECLQKASAYNPRDSRALSLLGEVYDIEEQGVDIAFALCQEAVELDDSKWDNWLRLGRVQYRNGRRQEAMIALQRSMKLDRFNLDAARILKKLYEDVGKKRLAEGMAEKIANIEKTCKRLKIK
jgi:tetratricopeptide (TPR) repeat protein